ncbi:VapE domain-containing protein [Cupriavidus sp. 2TAF22]|uniref:VapE domain-containing protein n=1 Tax=unclassified Cupriavidus TaxID=2640874 RepID=UPI003F9121FC
MTEGTARIESIGDVSELAAVLARMESNQAITCGVPLVGDTPLTTRAGADFRPDAVARTNEAFQYPYGAALFPIDVDVDGDTFQSVDAVLDALEACSPWLRHVSRVARPSSSSYVGSRGLRGVHVYLVVSRGTDIPALAKRMQIEQWAAGCGSIKISKSGALLTRQLADALVYQPSRLMFEAEPVLQGGITRTVPHDQAFVERPPQIIGAPARYRTPEGWLDVQAMTPQREIEARRFETAVRTAKNARRREAKRVAIDYQRANAIAQGLDPKEGERYGLLATRALGDKALPLSWQLAIKGGERVKVADVLANLAAYIGQQCADPFDTWRPDLDAKHFTKAEVVRMGDKPGVWSHKLQEFFAFTDDDAADIASPLDQAAEKLCGLVDYPEPAGRKAAPFVNVKHGIALLLRELDTLPRLNACTGRIERDDTPASGRLCDALSRIGCANVTPGTVESALEALAEENRYDPWKDTVLALPQWDKVARLDSFFPDLCGALPSDALTLTGQLLFAGIVARQLSPGAQCPVVPVLIGTQGTGKSRFVHELANALVVPPPSSLAFTEPRTMSMAAAVSPIAEIGEMSGMGRRDVEDIKQWITECEDVFRAPYARQAEAHPRRFVLVGTANKHELNRDETGNRRFMPIQVDRPIDPAWTVEAPQLFAEAKERFCDGGSGYRSLVDATQRAVRAFTDDQMRNGVGTPQTTVSELAPEIVRRLALQRSDRRVFVRDLLTQLASNPAGKGVGPRQLSAWMRTNGWEAGTSCGVTYYRVPDAYLTADAGGEAAAPFDADGNRPALALVQ